MLMQSRQVRPDARVYRAVYAHPPRGTVQGNKYSAFFVLCFVLVHVLLGLVLRQSATAAGIHALIVLAISIWAALRWSEIAVSCCAAYIVGAEVLWRMTEAPVPYEVGKYAVSLIFLIALIRMGRRAVWRPLPLAYFAVLLPSAALLSANQELLSRTVLMRLSFNLSGPLCLCFSVWFFSHQRFQPRDILRICLSLVGPIIAIAVVTLIATRTATDLSFSGESNPITSGGFGPNQVSAVLGLGAVVTLLLTVNTSSGIVIRITYAMLVLFFAAQSAMTFSRGGLYSATLAFVAGAPFLLAQRRMRRVLIPIAAVIIATAAWVVLPRLDEFTDGKLEARFTEVQATNRGDLVLDDFRIWFEHPGFGVGPGMVNDFRGPEVGGAGHTEYTRLLAEHGAFGVVALGALLLMSLRVLLDAGAPMSRGYRIIFITWALVSMLHSAMRIAAFGFVFGLAHAAIVILHQRSKHPKADNTDMLPLPGLGRRWATP